MQAVAFGFLPPETQQRIRQQEDERWERALEDAIPWDEDKTKFSECLCLQGGTFDVKRYRLFRTQPLTSMPGRGLPKKGLKWSPSKKYAYANRLLPRGGRLELAQGHKRGTVAFDSDVIVPVLFEHKPQITWQSPLSVWMGCTPMEMLTQRQGVRRAKGHVILGGLGLGWLLWKVAEKKSVTKVTVVEISQELLDWYGNDLCERVREATGTEIEVVCDNVLNHLGEHGDEARYIVDIWPDYPTYVHHLSSEWRKAIARCRYFWGWGVLEDPDSYRGW